ncbi:MAG: HNH endonuclease family protein [Candidatus Acidiferrales bacterium]
MYAALGRRLFQAKDTQDAVKVIQELKKKLCDRVPSLLEFKALFPNIVLTDNITKQRRLVRYVLVELERRRADATVVDYEQMTIEHLAPQSLIGQVDYDDALIGQLGNLMLVPDGLNAKLRNKTFKDKKRILLEANFKLPKLIEEATDWTPTEIVARTEHMAEKAYQAWKP